MKLDSRILEGKKPLDCFDVEEAKQFIGKKGYFCDHRSGFKNISDLVEDVLRDITPDDNYCEVYKTNCTSWEYFLPEEWIKEPEEKPEKKYRPYTKHEFLNKFECGKPINIRRKDDYINFFIETMPSVKIDNLSDDVHVRLFEGIFNLKRLFDEFEWQDSNGNWHPFGIIDE